MTITLLSSNWAQGGVDSIKQLC